MADFFGPGRQPERLPDRLEVAVVVLRQSPVVFIDRHFDTSLAHPPEETFRIGHLLRIPVITGPDYLGGGIRIEHDHIQRQGLVAEPLYNHLPFLVRITGAGAKPGAQDISRNQRAGSNQLSQVFQAALVILAINQEIPVLAILVWPELDPCGGLVPQRRMAVIEEKIPVSA